MDVSCGVLSRPYHAQVDGLLRLDLVRVRVPPIFDARRRQTRFPFLHISPGELPRHASGHRRLHLCFVLPVFSRRWRPRRKPVRPPPPKMVGMQRPPTLTSTTPRHHDVAGTVSQGSRIVVQRPRWAVDGQISQCGRRRYPLFHFRLLSERGIYEM